ncbi:MAG: isoprenylcysteine carboxylmethyltransferase family protein [Hyphomicrobiales bacterium]
MHIPPPVFALGAVLILYGGDKILPSLSIHPQGQWFVGLFCVVIGVAVAVISVGIFRKKKTTITPVHPEKASTLVTSGVYNYTRNPMYLGMAFCVAGIGIGLGSLLTLVVLPIFVWLITHIQISIEEEALEKRFGEAYKDYASKVRRWV